MHGFTSMHTDADGDGIDDLSGMSYGHGFGWVDADGDGVNDAYADADADGVNDFTDHGYTMGFRHMGDGGHSHDPIDWPMGPPMHDDGPGGRGMMGGGMM
jgi:hypothetical protein